MKKALGLEGWYRPRQIGSAGFDRGDVRNYEKSVV
jgi:hypothetical protein